MKSNKENIFYPILKLPFDIEIQAFIPPKPDEPKKPSKREIRIPIKPTIIDSASNDKITFPKLIFVILINILIIIVLFKMTNIIIALIYCILITIGVIQAIIENNPEKNKIIIKEITEKYNKEVRLYENELVKIDQEYEVSLALYKNKIVEYQVEIEKLTSEDYLKKYKLSKSSELLRKAKKPIENEISYSKGVTEDYFFSYLQGMFGNRIYRNLTLKGNEWSGKGQLYQPDFVFYDPEIATLAIEIDEPYIGKNGIPIHYVGSDDCRDSYFTENKWIVIRFSEEQIIKETFNCCCYIAGVLYTHANYLLHVNWLISDGPAASKQWTKEEAHTFAFQRLRNKYLPIDLQIKLKEEINQASLIKFHKDEDLPF